MEVEAARDLIFVLAVELAVGQPEKVKTGAPAGGRLEPAPPGSTTPRVNDHPHMIIIRRANEQDLVAAGGHEPDAAIVAAPDAAIRRLEAGRLLILLVLKGRHADIAREVLGGVLDGQQEGPAATAGAHIAKDWERVVVVAKVDMEHATVFFSLGEGVLARVVRRIPDDVCDSVRELSTLLSCQRLIAAATVPFGIGAIGQSKGALGGSVRPTRLEVRATEDPSLVAGRAVLATSVEGVRHLFHCAIDHLDTREQPPATDIRLHPTLHAVPQVVDRGCINCELDRGGVTHATQHLRTEHGVLGCRKRWQTLHPTGTLELRRGVFEHSPAPSTVFARPKEPCVRPNRWGGEAGGGDAIPA